MPVNVLDHPLAAHIITHLRDKTTKPIVTVTRGCTFQVSFT